MTDATITRRGRPRDSSIDDRVLAATRRVLVDEGYAATTIPRIADSAGVHASAIYRRWSSRVELIHDAAYGDLAPRRVRPTGDLRRDLERFLRAYVGALESPIVRAAMPALLSFEARDRERQPSALLHISLRPQFRDVIAAAPNGVVDPRIDLDDVFDLLLGAALARVAIPPGVRRRAPLARTVDLLLRALAPPS
jgi:AcrR family transcriptional regulator